MAAKDMVLADARTLIQDLLNAHKSPVQQQFIARVRAVHEAIDAFLKPDDDAEPAATGTRRTAGK
jgi:hypothetical protein